MFLKFEKWHGAKNDFVLTWLLGDDELIFDSLVRQAPEICSRDGSGVSADGILVLHISEREQIFPDRLSIINSDGSIAETCGNGIRCAALSVLKRHRYYSPRDIPEGFAMDLRSSSVSCRFLGRGKLETQDHWPLVSVDMGHPKLNQDCQLYEDAKQEVSRIADELKLPQLKRDWGIIDISNQHLVFFLDQADRDLLLRVGPAFQKSAFWDGINVHLAVTQDVDNKLKTEAGNKLGQAIDDLYQVFVWERGAGETMACGSGACAVAALALDSGLVERSQWLGVAMPGGLLYCKQESADDQVNLAGPAQFVFEGTIEI
ncbi:diaminopimelate epimerase [Pseudobacteriovorax antillogorgiicola]|uniref:Diaminopimelate epimerase n=1 Tax=Pseudobacteriovorax antillogorgiicola TaxID=1513793 RepID=A0A1Y6CI73_9BACT|nr:diaminopimelate epimerase [Pseudobacteriovorax antillogorgiicola]TCS46729.1 diaminopimelate epimerase [Pseudobacteriovorax antillogorgiicola]SMF67181.1 diaminopimelate epimerase [Pseudobacteriovorax antillogorgiicola]